MNKQELEKMFDKRYQELDVKSNLKWFIFETIIPSIK